MTRDSLTRQLPGVTFDDLRTGHAGPTPINLESLGTECGTAGFSSSESEVKTWWDLKWGIEDEAESSNGSSKTGAEPWNNDQQTGKEVREEIRHVHCW